MPLELKELPKQERRMRVELDRQKRDGTDAQDDRIPICMSSEEPYQRWWGTEILGHAADEIDMSYADQGLAFCADHDITRQVGVVEEVELGDDGKLRGMLRMGAHPDASWIKQDILSGVRWGISVGYRIDRMQLEEEDGDGNCVYRVVRWTPMECSTVAAPADASVGVGRDAGRAAFPLQVELPAALNSRSAGGDEGMSDTTKNGAASPPAGQTADQLRDAIRTEERQRIADITQLAREHGVMDRVNELADCTREQAGLKILEMKRAGAPVRPVISHQHDRSEDKPWSGFGDFLRAVVQAGPRGSTPDVRLLARASGMSEGVPSDGGFAVPVEYAAEIMKNVWATGQVLSRCRKIPIGANASGIKVNVIKEDSRANGSRYGGAQMFWAAEAATGTASKPQLRQIELSLQKLIGLWYLTDELMQDASALAAEAQNAFEQELIFKIEDAIFNGTGAGMPLGILNSGAVVQQAIEAAQTLANTPASIAINTAKMYARMQAALVPNSAWFINQDVLPYLVTATLGGTAAAQPVYLPPGAIKDSPNGSLWGRPIIPVEYCATVGTPGDIVFANLNEYLVAEKGGAQFAQSMHVQFLTDEMTFRLTYRMDGQPRLNTPITPFKGSNTQSAYITLATRS